MELKLKFEKEWEDIIKGGTGTPQVRQPLCSVTVLPHQSTSGKHPHSPWHLRTDTADQSPCGFLWLHGHWIPFLQNWQIAAVSPFHPLCHPKACLLDGELKFSSSLVFWVWKTGFQSRIYKIQFSELGVVVQEFNPSTWEAEWRSLWTKDQPGLHTVSHTSQSYIVRPCLKNQDKV